MLHPELYFVDGENLVMRFQDMVTAGRKPRPSTVHLQDVFVWAPALIAPVGDVRRVTYYTSAVGDGDKIREITKSIRSLTYYCTDSHHRRDA